MTWVWNTSGNCSQSQPSIEVATASFCNLRRVRNLHRLAVKSMVLGESVRQEVSRGFSWIFSSSEI